MRTIVVSDLHLGKSGRHDLARRADLRAALLEAVAGADRLVVRGDGLELREAPHREAADIAAPFFAEAGRALGGDGELVVVAGNHDHGLAAGWIDARLQSEPPGFLGLEQRYAPHESGPLAERLAQAARPARLELAYPGLWLRDDVYALHGHYAHLHATVPTFERLPPRAPATTPTCTPPCRRSSGSPRAPWPASSCGCRKRAPRRTTTRPRCRRC